MNTMSWRLVSLLAAMALLMAACGDDDATATTEAPATTVAATTSEAPATTVAATTTEAPATTTVEAPFEAPEGALVSVAADTPTLDGIADEAAWADAPGITVGVTGGGQSKSSES